MRISDWSSDVCSSDLMVSKTALDLGLKGVTVESVERRIDQLVQNRQIVMGTAHATDRDGKMVTTQEALRIEEKILDLVKEGNGAAKDRKSTRLNSSH